MSESENVSPQVLELLELVCKDSRKPEEHIVATTDFENIVDVQDLQNESGNDQLPAVISNDLVLKTNTLMITGSEGSQSTHKLDNRVIQSQALKMIAQYESGESESESSDDVLCVNDVLEKTITEGNYRVVSLDSQDSTSSDDSSDCEVISVQNEIINLDDDYLDESSKPKVPIRAEGEFTIDSLPPIQDLKISVSEEQCVILGKVMSIVDQLVVVDALPGSRPIDIDSVLFLEKGEKPLGQVFDVLGNIASPMYCVRFNSNQQIHEKGITVGTMVYIAPSTEYTSFVMVSELMKNKGCDASWKDDIEPKNAQDFSDDEEERNARNTRRGRNNSIDTAANNIPHRASRRRGRGGFQRGDQNPNGFNFGYSTYHNLQTPTWNSESRMDPSYLGSLYQGPPYPASPYSLPFHLPPPPPPPSNRY